MWMCCAVGRWAWRRETEHSPGRWAAAPSSHTAARPATSSTPARSAQHREDALMRIFMSVELIKKSHSLAIPIWVSRICVDGVWLGVQYLFTYKDEVNFCSFLHFSSHVLSPCHLCMCTACGIQSNMKAFSSNAFPEVDTFTSRLYPTVYAESLRILGFNRSSSRAMSSWFTQRQWACCTQDLFSLISRSCCNTSALSIGTLAAAVQPLQVAGRTGPNR
jgi:hypothetical protein